MRKQRMDYIKARDMLLEVVKSVDTESVLLEKSNGRILARRMCAELDVPAYDRSPYDGYAFCSEDVKDASRENPVVLDVVEEIAAGNVPVKPLIGGTAAKILTGAVIPEGADAVVPYEMTEFTDTKVKLFSSVEGGTNIVRAGEDIQAGTLLAKAGTVIDAGLAGSLAAQGIGSVDVYRKPIVGIISTGNEVMETGERLERGKIYNTNRYTLTGALETAGCQVIYLGLVGDMAESISKRITDGLVYCDAILLTGGVSVGDYDLTPLAMTQAGVELLVQGVSVKPGMACAYGIKKGKLVLGLSGNPASAITNFHAVVAPSIRKLCGNKNVIPDEMVVTLAEPFPKKSKTVRFLRGKMDLSSGTVKMHLSDEQGNVVIHTMAGCDLMAIVPAGSGPLPAGTKLKGFRI